MDPVRFGLPMVFSNRRELTTTQWLIEKVDDALDICGTQMAWVHYDGRVDITVRRPDSWEVTALKVVGIFTIGILLLIAKVILRYGCEILPPIPPVTTPPLRNNPLSVPPPVSRNFDPQTRDPQRPAKPFGLNLIKLLKKYPFIANGVDPVPRAAEDGKESKPFYVSIQVAFNFVANRIHQSISTHGPSRGVVFDFRSAPLPPIAEVQMKDVVIPDPSHEGMITLMNRRFEELPEIGEASKNLLLTIFEVLKLEKIITGYSCSEFEVEVHTVQKGKLK
ncbi:MAG: hypothetical protein HYX48_03095 [Chlamydiales bacterium]|nr:hypothetical protein [Chlamydiales bacterium]